MTAKRTLTERIQDALTRYPARTNREIAKNINGSTSRDVAAVRDRETGKQDASTPVVAASPVVTASSVVAAPRQPKRVSRNGHTFAAFRASNDVGCIIARKVVELLPDEGEEYFTDHEFREACGVPIASWRRHADDGQFAQYRLVRGQHNYWAPRPMVPKMKMILGI